MQIIKTSFLTFCLIISAHLSAANDRNFWQINLSKTFSKQRGSTDYDSFTYTNETYETSDINSFSIKFLHDFGPLPQVKLQQSNVSESQSFTRRYYYNSDFVEYQNTPFSTRADASHLDLTLFYKIIDKRVDFLLGTSFIKTKGDAFVTHIETNETTQTSLSDDLTTLYVAVEAELTPQWHLVAELDMFLCIIVECGFWDADLRAEYSLNSDFSIGFGYRYDNLLEAAESQHNIYAHYQGVSLSASYQF